MRIPRHAIPACEEAAVPSVHYCQIVDAAIDYVPNGGRHFIFEIDHQRFWKSGGREWSARARLTLSELDDAAASSIEAVADVLQDRTGSSASRIRNDFAKRPDEIQSSKLLAAWDGDVSLWLERYRMEPCILPGYQRRKIFGLDCGSQLCARPSANRVIPILNANI